MEIVFLFYDGMTALDAIGPHEVLTRLPNAKVKRVARHSGPVVTGSSGLVLNAEFGLADVSYADLLVLPGAGKATSFKDCPEVLDWVRAIHATTKWTTSVCTGSLILGAAGLLYGLKATTHWAAMDRLKFWGAEATHSRVVEDGKIITAAGVSAGIDMALMLANKISGSQVAQSLQLAIEYDPDPPFDCGSPEKANQKNLETLRSRFLNFFEKIKEDE
jgi:transcriptional regulator GlxA family with amidase domain